jgi:hypothetical protein
MLTGLVVIAAAVTASAQSAVPSSHHASARVCPTSQLQIRLARSFVAAGNVGGYIAFVNRAGIACRLTGWPKLVAVTAVGRSTTALRVRSTMWGPHLAGVPVVTLRPGKAAGVAFAASDISGPGQTRCPPPYRHLRVTPPGNTRPVMLSAWLHALNAYLPACSRVTVTMVVRASDLKGA